MCLEQQGNSHSSLLQMFGCGSLPLRVPKKAAIFFVTPLISSPPWPVLTMTTTTGRWAALPPFSQTHPHPDAAKVSILGALLVGDLQREAEVVLGTQLGYSVAVGREKEDRGRQKGSLYAKTLGPKAH